mgnify:CR=1 FL=1
MLEGFLDMQDIIFKLISYLGVVGLLSAFVIPMYQHEGFEPVAIMLLTAILAKIIMIEEK